MSTKKQISSLCKLYSVYEEKPEQFLVETDVDSYFYHNILDISQSHHRIVRVSKGSNKKSFAIKVFRFCDSKLQQRFIPKEDVSIYGCLCNNSEIHLWLWKVWSLVVCSQSSFHVTRARKDDKNRQNTFFLC